MPERWDEFKVSSTERQVVRALGSIGSATLVSRVVGFVRDIVVALVFGAGPVTDDVTDRKSTRLNSSHLGSSYAVFCLKKKTVAADPTKTTGPQRPRQDRNCYTRGR